MSDAPTRIIVHGASGRMGARICELALRDQDFDLVAAIERADAASLGSRAAPGQHNAPIIQTSQEIAIFADVVVDFTSDAGACEAVEIARRARAALLVGTTALSSVTVDNLRAEAANRAVMLAPNTSLGVAVVARAATNIAAALGKNFDAAIVESHHRHKLDAPSGTAKRLADAVRRGGNAIDDDQIHAIRGGDVIGEHTIRFSGPGECIEITHRATSRDLFVLGALRAAKFLSRQRAGWFTIEDSLDLPAR